MVVNRGRRKSFSGRVARPWQLSAAMRPTYRSATNPSTTTVTHGLGDSHGEQQASGYFVSRRRAPVQNAMFGRGRDRGKLEVERRRELNGWNDLCCCISMRFRNQVQVLFNFRIIGWEGKKRFLWDESLIFFFFFRILGRGIVFFLFYQYFYIFIRCLIFCTILG